MDALISELESELSNLVKQARAGLLEAGEHSLDRSSYVILGLLEEHGPMRIGEMADVAGLDKSTMSRQIEVAERGNHVAKTKDADRRASKISITTSGRSALRAIRAEQHDQISATISGWTETERADLLALLTRYNKSLREQRDRSRQTIHDAR